MFEELPAGVCTAFGVPGAAAVRLPGGGGVCWQVGEVVLKPGQGPKAGAWLAEVFADLRGPGFRVARPVRAVDGSWVVDGWAAWGVVEGEADPVGRWPELVAASRAFHRALVDVPAPRWLERGRDRWTVADRVAWDGVAVEVAPELVDLVDAVRAATRPVRLPEQLVHADIAGNVLFAPGQLPTVIDFSPSWRPAGYALAIAAVDVLTWSAAPPEILDELADEPDIDQLLLRALMWRLVTESLGRADPESLQAVRRANEPVVDLLLSRVTGRKTRDLAKEAGSLLGCEITGLRPVSGGHSSAVPRLADRADGGQVFIKAGRELDVELAVYEAGGPFLPKLLAKADDMLIVEALEPNGWVREWTPQLIDATHTLLHEIHTMPPPPGVPKLEATANPWDVIAKDPARLLRMNVCTSQWLADHLDILHTATAQASTTGDSLIHRDVRAANLWYHNQRLVLVDWASAVIGNPRLDLHLWLVSRHAEGGPAPDTDQGPEAPGHAALIAGQQPLLTPTKEADPVLFTQRCRQLTMALIWAARLLDIPPPTR